METTPASILRNHTYLRMLLAYGLSTIGDYFDYIAIMILIGYVWKLSPVALALYPIMYALPGMLLGQFTGVVADRSNQVRIMVTCDFIRGLLTVFLIFAPNPWVAYPLLLLRGTAAVFSTPANQALTRRVVASEHLLKATTYNRAVFQFTKIFAPFVGGTIAALASPATCLLVNAVSFAVSACILLTLRNVPEVEALNRKTKDPFLAMWKQGWKLLFTIRIVFVSTIFYLSGTIIVQIIESQYTTLFRDLAPDRAALRGWFTSAIGIGAFAAVMTMNRLNRLFKPGIVLGGGLALEGVMCTILGALNHSTNSIWPLVGGVLGGIGSGFLVTGYNYLIQRETPRDANGRIFGILSTLFNVNIIVGPLLGGVLVTRVGPTETFEFVGVILLLIGVIGLAFQRVICHVHSQPGETNTTMAEL